MNPKKIVIIGGGHGQAMICRSIKDLDNVQISAIVTVADDGGSTGRLREIFHLPAMGDIRNVLLSLSDDSVLKRLMNYRFVNEANKDSEDDVLGHNLGNLIFTALANETGSFDESIDILSEMLHARGKVLPVTDQIVTLNAMMKDGTRVRGEKNIPNIDNQIEKVFYDGPVTANPEVIKTIEEADYIIYGIGSIYTSILPNVIIPQINNALQNCKAPKIYFCNAMTQPGETDNYSMEDHVQALVDHHALVDTVIVANDVIPTKILERYHSQHQNVVRQEKYVHDYKVIEASLLSYDTGLIRHNPDKIKDLFIKLLNGEL